MATGVLLFFFWGGGGFGRPPENKQSAHEYGLDLVSRGLCDLCCFCLFFTFLLGAKSVKTTSARMRWWRALSHCARIHGSPTPPKRGRASRPRLVARRPATTARHRSSLTDFAPNKNVKKKATLNHSQKAWGELRPTG